MRLLSFLMVAMLLATPAFAQFNPSPNDPQAPVQIERYKGTLADFTKVEFLCNADTSGDYIATAICTLGENEVRTQARKLGLDMTVSSGRDAEDSFMIYIHATSAGIAPRATSIRVEASRYLKAAIDKSASYSSPAAFPRRGKLVLYEDTITAVGQGDNLEHALRRQLQTVLRKFFRQVEDGTL